MWHWGPERATKMGNVSHERKLPFSTLVERIKAEGRYEKMRKESVQVMERGKRHEKR